MTTNNDFTGDQQQQQLDEAESYHLGPRKSSSIKKRETFDSAYLRRPNVVDRSSSASNEENHDTNNRLTIQNDTIKLRRRHSDVPEGKREEKRLVVVDSTYINVSTVGDGYAKISKTQQRNSLKNRENRNSDSERLLSGDSLSPSQLVKRNSLKNNQETENWTSEPEFTAVSITTKYRADDESLRPFDSSIDATLPSNISDTYTKDRSMPDTRLCSNGKEPLSDNYASINNEAFSPSDTRSNTSCNELYYRPPQPQREHLFSDSHVSSSRERLQESQTLKERRTSDSCNTVSKDTVVVTAGSRRRHLDSVGTTTTTSSSLNASNLSLLTSSNSSLPSNFSAEDELHLMDDALCNLSLSTEQLPMKSNENLTPVVASPTMTDGHAHSSHSGKLKKHKLKDKEHKEKKKHKHKKHHKRNNSKDTVEDPLESLAQNIKSFESPTPAKKNQRSGHSSDDSKSIDSFDSLEDFQQPSSAASSQPARAVPKGQYYSSSDSNRTTPEKSLDSELTTRTQSPQCLEGDAKLVSKLEIICLTLLSLN